MFFDILTLRRIYQMNSSETVDAMKCAQQQTYFNFYYNFYFYKRKTNIPRLQIIWPLFEYIY